MLTDTHMFASMKLLNKAFPQLSVCQDPLLSQSTGFNPAEKEQFVQILHVGGNHWITVSWDGFEVTIYDSLSDSLHRRMKRRPNFALPSEVELMVAQLVHPRSQGDEIPVVVPKVQQQTDGVSCGLFAVASAVEAAMGSDLAQARYVKQMFHFHYQLTPMITKNIFMSGVVPLIADGT